MAGQFKTYLVSKTAYFSGRMFWFPFDVHTTIIEERIFDSHICNEFVSQKKKTQNFGIKN